MATLIHQSACCAALASVFDSWRLNDKPALLIGMDALSRMSTLSIDYRRKELAMAMYSECGSTVCSTEP